MKLNRDYIIPFVGLKIGSHKFEFDITDAFFDNYEYSIIRNGNVKVELNLEKKETMLVGDYTISGVVQSECDRCTDPMDADVSGEYQLIYKFDTEPSDDESLIIVYPEEFELNIADSILELITVSLPLRTIHEEGECNEEMIEQLKEYVLVEDVFEDKSDDESFENSEDEDNDDDDQEIDPRWAALKGLK
ncbi:MAG: DUF177 domain-containing protein [Crocinitomicaceae bacterium]|nr:DUF177 domain-containing protein [Crocinitomicaceae bacterium]